jgi:hypothetical protein
MLSKTPLPLPLPPASRRLDDPVPGEEASRRSFGGGMFSGFKMFSGCDSMEVMHVSRIRLSSCSGDDHRGALARRRRRRSRTNLQPPEPRTARRPSLQVPLPGVVVGGGARSRW